MDLTAELDKPIAINPAGGYLTLREFQALSPTMQDQIMGRMEELLKEAATKPAPRKRVALREGQFAEVPEEEIDYEIESPNKWFGSHTNLIPLQSAVAGPRVFYGARFANQAMPIVNREVPWVQASIDGDEQGRSFDDFYGARMGSITADTEGQVTNVTPEEIELRLPTGKKKKVSLYRDFPLNRKSGITSTPLVKPGDAVKPGHLLADSNYTKGGTLAMGVNARTGLVPYLGHSMDDAIVISNAFAKRLTQQGMYSFDTDYKRGVKGGKSHYTGLFPQKFILDQLKKLDDDGVVKEGQVLNPGDPIILATRPKVISSTTAQLGKLSSHMRNARHDASLVWDHDEPARVVDVKKLRGGVRINVVSEQPTKIGDKIVFRSGQKGTVSLILPDEHMPRTVDGQPLEVLLNPQGIPSRVNNSLPYELMLGKIAKKLGKPYKLPTFNKPNEQWFQFVEQELKKHGMTDTEEVYDPLMHRRLERPITVGEGYVLKLHHTSESKASYRGQGSYDLNEQPARGAGELAQAKKLGGLEAHSLLSSGAYNVLREAATLRGQRNDDYWRMLRAGHDPKEPGVPFAWNKFKALLTGAGFHTQHRPGGAERLGFWSDKDLKHVNPIEIKKGELVDLKTLTPVPGGLFDNAVTGANAWGYIQLPHPVPNPAAEEVIRKLLGLTEKQFRAIMAGEEEMPMHLLMGKRSAKTKAS